MTLASPLLDSERRALEQRLIAVAETLEITTANRPTVDLLAELVERCRESRRAEDFWLLFVGLTGAFPNQTQLADFRRQVALATAGGGFVSALGATIDAASRADDRDRTIKIVTTGVVVDVNFCARHDHNTGIQRVVRETIPRWADDGHEIHLVAWTDLSPAFRGLSPTELSRVLAWNKERVAEHEAHDPTSTEHEIVVPWKTTVFFPEVPFGHLCSSIAALAESSGNSTAMLGYDAIPLVSADLLGVAESERFAHYLSAVKHVDSVIAISRSAAEEFSGFTQMLPAQGLRGPRVSAIPLAFDVPATPEQRSTDKPTVLCVGSHEPRKNQEAILLAGEILHREGRDFRLIFVGGGSRLAVRHFDGRVKRLRRSGFDVHSYRRLSDADLWGMYAQSRFTAFVSLHEGFGLPVAESLALGVPALTSDYGSLAEIARDGGCVMVNPRDDEQVVDAMRELLDNDALIDRLREEARRRSPRTWNAYSRELWAKVSEVA